MEKIIFTAEPIVELHQVVEEIKPDKVIVITDTHVAELLANPGYDLVTIPCGEESKSIQTVEKVWVKMSSAGLTRSSLVVNVGGGVVTDLGGFAASTFKRGIKFVNMPTTVLAAVDASVGGKTGVNLGGLKNEIGTFSSPETVIISNSWFNTLPMVEKLSGYGEMLKHALLSSSVQFNKLTRSFHDEIGLDELRENIEVKTRIVSSDPCETGMRKALNLGHTFGHGFEELSFLREGVLPHGFAVAYGLLSAMILSHIMLGFPSKHLYGYAEFLKDNFMPVKPLSLGCNDYPCLLELMRHDKKNNGAGGFNFTLLREVGRPEIDRIADEGQVETALDITRDLLGI